jgi:hypothetical protein
MIWFIPWKVAAAVMHACFCAHRITFRVDRWVCWMAVKSCSPHSEMKARYQRAKERDA